jgi:uncharacterized protein
MVVVSDTSPIRALHHLALVPLMGNLFGEVLVPPAVVAELQNPSSGLPSITLDQLPEIRVVAPSSTAKVAELILTLDPGESEAISLALELRAAVLIDEEAGRRVARQLGLPVVGVIGLLLRAKQRGLIGDVGPLVVRLRREIKFFISDAFLREVLSLAGEPLP